MIIFKYSKDLQAHLKKIKRNNVNIGFVPTMGALHAGHISLIEKSKKETDTTICSIYVNPVQFNNADDYKNYPVTIEADILMLDAVDCDILFLPDEKEIYPDNNAKRKHFDIGYLESILEGKYRPGHFQGVCMVVERLLNIVQPSHLFLGQKDFQQSLVIKRLLKLMNQTPEVVIVPTLREPNGLAMSSRNLRLSENEKDTASELYKSLIQISKQLAPGKIEILKESAARHLESLGFKLDYLEIATTENLKTIHDLSSNEDLVILIAAFLNNVRLIDNLIVTS
ncbi:MAG: pantoate--beta-alanine ligase [Ginsengibacter sp.]